MNKELLYKQKGYIKNNGQRDCCNQKGGESFSEWLPSMTPDGKKKETPKERMIKN